MATFNGIIVLNKPGGMTSHDCVAQIRKWAGMKKVGHTGTLDPEATGVLPICLGQATRVAQYLIDDQKEYVAKIKLGQSTTTEDHTGDIIQDQPVETRPSTAEIIDCMQHLIGKMEQIPPMYSAVKTNGKRLYKLAQQGEVVERKPREVTIYQLELLHYEPSLPYPLISFRAVCSKGTYIRTLGVEIGQKLRSPAHLVSLIRTQSGPFTIEESIDLKDVQSWNQEDWHQNLLPFDSALTQFPKLVLDDERISRIQQGQKCKLDDNIQHNQLYRVYNLQAQFIALCLGSDSGMLQPKKVFHR